MTHTDTFDLAKAHLDDLRAEAAHQHLVRLARASDRGAVRAFLSRLSPRTIQARYLSSAVPLDEERADLELRRLFDNPAPERTVVLAMFGPEVRGIGEFTVEGDDQAELGLLVEDAFQGRGIGKGLLRALQRLAAQRGIEAFTGDVGHTNSRMLRLLRATGRKLRTQPDYGSLRFTLRLRS